MIPECGLAAALTPLAFALPSMMLFYHLAATLQLARLYGQFPSVVPLSCASSGVHSAVIARP